MTRNASTTPPPAMPSADPSAPSPQAIKASQRKLLLILACFGVPLLLAIVWLQVLRASDGTLGDTSRGQLVQPPLPFEEFTLQDADGQPWGLAELRGLWTLLYLPEGACEEACEKNLYHMRQVRLALNQRMDRVQRVVVTASPDQLGEALVEEHPGLQVLGGDATGRASFADQVRASESAAGDAAPFGGIWLVDPNGNLMLRFDPELDPRMMLKDVKHLLKISRIG